jgi:hypothetical protein
MEKYGYRFMKVIPGLVLLALGVAAVYNWWPQLLLVAKAALGPLLLLAGAVVLAMAKGR